MDAKIIQNIFDVLQDGLPDTWEKVVFYAAYAQGSYSMKYFVKSENEYKDCFSLEEISENQIINLFVNMDEIISSYRNTLKNSDKWSVLTMSVNSNGEFKTDFDYSDLSEKLISFEEDWKKTYLK